MGDFFSDLTDQVLQPLGLTESSAENAESRRIERLEDLSLPELREFTPEELTYGEDYAKNFTRQGDTEFGKISLDPRLRENQFAALEKMRAIADAEGLTPEDRALLDQISREEGARERGSREAVLQNAQARGVGGSGLEGVSQLLAGQTAATNRNIRGTDVAALAQRRALDAIRGTADMAGSIRGQEYGEASDKAQAQDIINRFNTGGFNDATMETMRRRNAAMDANVANRNQAQLINNAIRQDRFGNEMSQVTGISNADAARAGARDSRVGGGLIGSAVGGVKDTIGDFGSAAAGGALDRFLQDDEERQMSPGAARLA